MSYRDDIAVTDSIRKLILVAERPEADLDDIIPILTRIVDTLEELHMRLGRVGSVVKGEPDYA